MFHPRMYIGLEASQRYGSLYGDVVLERSPEKQETQLNTTTRKENKISRMVMHQFDNNQER